MNADDPIEQLQDVQHDEKCERGWSGRHDADYPMHTSAACGCYARAAIQLGIESAAAGHTLELAEVRQAFIAEGTELRRQNAVMREALRGVLSTGSCGIEGGAHSDAVDFATRALDSLRGGDE